MPRRKVAERGRRMGGGEVRLVGLVKRFEDVTAVDGIDLEVLGGDFFAVLVARAASRRPPCVLSPGSSTRPRAASCSTGPTWPAPRPTSARSTLSSKATPCY